MNFYILVMFLTPVWSSAAVRFTTYLIQGLEYRTDAKLQRKHEQVIAI